MPQYLCILRMRASLLHKRREFWTPLDFFGNKSGSCQLSSQNVTDHGVNMTNKKQDLIDQRLQDLNDDDVAYGDVAILVRIGVQVGAGDRP